MRALIVDNHSKHIAALRELLEQNGYDVEVISYADIEPADAKRFDLTILSGGTGMAIPSHRGEFADEIALIRTTSKPLLGICLGAELIADTFGAELRYRQQRVTGLEEIGVIAPDPIFGELRSFHAKVAHKYYLETLAEPLVSLAKSKSGIEVFRHGQKPIYGFQFHPEIAAPGNEGAALFENFLKTVTFNHHD